MYFLRGVRSKLGMAEVGLVKLARVSLGIAAEVVAERRSKYSKKLYSQPQLLAILVLMRYEDWSLREAEVRLNEHAELRRALQLRTVPDYSTLCLFVGRLREQDLAKALQAVAKKFPGYKAQRGVAVAVDSTGLGRGALSAYYVRRRSEKHHIVQPWSTWLKWLVVVDVCTGLLLAQSAHPGPSNDSEKLRTLVRQAHELQPISEVLADAEFDSERNHLFVREQLRAHSVIPAKRGKPGWRVQGIRAQMRENFPHEAYRQRNRIESFFSSVKRKLSQRAPGRLMANRIKQALLLGLTYNLYRLKRPFLS